LVAELPRKDPDGFEYRELWILSIGLGKAPKMFFEIALNDPEYLLHLFRRVSGHLEEMLRRSVATPVTFLFILPHEPAGREILGRLLGHESVRDLVASSGYNVRFRVWDQTYLTSLVHQFPQIGYKYFSDEGRIRSKTRKSYEELYKENVDILTRERRLNAELEEEKNRRVRAERDAVWKDISFSAAHKIGNPIFAIETDLDPLARRIKEQRTEEAQDVVENIRASVEKAKAFVEQFKSLAKAQEIKPCRTPLRPILDDVQRSLSSANIECQIECDQDVTLWADPERLGECIDELVANATHWFDKTPKRMEFTVVDPVPEPFPDFLDTSRKYVLLHVKDNGPGIAYESKAKVFDAFFTTYDHGMGLGLALVRMIIEGHGGRIIETGRPGDGADFETYLPLPPDAQEHRPAVARKRPRKKTKEEGNAQDTCS